MLRCDGRITHLRTAGTSLVMDLTKRVPTVPHWGKDLGTRADPGLGDDVRLSGAHQDRGGSSRHAPDTGPRLDRRGTHRLGGPPGPVLITTGVPMPTLDPEQAMLIEVRKLS
jgi:hypothetical protein